MTPALPPPRFKILVAEDDKETCEFIVRLLDLWDLPAVHAVDGAQAIEKALIEKPDLILLDVMMPKRDGFDVCKTLKQHPDTRHIPIIMLTALSMMGDLQKAFQAGADDYATKPFDPVNLKSKIQKLLAWV